MKWLWNHVAIVGIWFHCVGLSELLSVSPSNCFRKVADMESLSLFGLESWVAVFLIFFCIEHLEIVTVTFKFAQIGMRSLQNSSWSRILTAANILWFVLFSLSRTPENSRKCLIPKRPIFQISQILSAQNLAIIFIRFPAQSWATAQSYGSGFKKLRQVHFFFPALRATF